MAMRFGVVFAASVGLSGLFACAPATNTRPATLMPSRSTAPAPRSAPPADPPESPLFVQRTGDTVVTELPSSEATAIGRLDTARATYLLVRAHHDQELDGAVLNSVVDGTGKVLVSAVSGTGASSQSLASPDYTLLIRIPGPSPRDLPTELRWTTRGSLHSGRWRGGYRQTIKVSGFDSAPIRKDLETQFGEAMAQWFELTSGGEPFAAFAAGRLRHKLATPAGERGRSVGRGERGRIALADLMDFYTARSAISDSLQTRRGLQVGGIKQPATESIAALEAEIRAESMSTIGATSCPNCAGLSDYIPAESLAIEFATLKDLVQLPKLLDAKFGPLMRLAEAAGGSNHLMERYREQLAIELDGFAETAGQFAVKRVAVVFSDPYLREGTDFTLVFKAENPALLEGVLENHLQRARHQHPDLRSAREQIAGQAVTSNTTPDGRVRRFEYAFDDYRVVSNSRAALARIIRTRLGARSLSQDPDYIAARASSPFDPKKERALLFFGNGFVAEVVGPRSKILESRRMRAKAELQAVDHAALLYGWMEGHRPAGLGELIQSGWLEKPDLTHFDGSAISWSPSLGAHSTWGYAQALTPIADLQLTKVTKDEVSAYRNFRARYEAEMRGVLDPTTLRFERTSDSDDAIAASLSIFPIARGGEFNRKFRHELELIGGGRIVPGKATRGVSVGVGIGDDSPLRKLFDGGMLDLFGKRELSANFVGDWAMAGIDEGAGIWDIAGERNLIARVDSPRNESPGFGFDRLARELPVWFAVHVRSKLLVTAAITALRAKLNSVAPTLLEWHQDSNYRGVAITRIHAAENDTARAEYVDIFYALANDVLLASLRRSVLTARIDEVLSGRTPRGGRLPENSAQWILDWAPQRGGWLHRTAQAVLDQGAIEAHERACTGLQLLTRGTGPLPTNSDERRALALRLLGYEPEPPQGGELRWQNGQCEGGHYGSAVGPSVPDLQNPNLLLHQVLSKIEFLRITLGTVQKDDAVELRARFESSHGPSHPNH